MRITPRNLTMALSIVVWATQAGAQTIVGVVEDGPQSRQVLPLTLLETEIRGLVGDEFEILMPENKQLNGAWSLEGVRAAIQRLLDDPEVDIIITTGLTASSEAARIDSLSKPVIASVVADAQLQGFPGLRQSNRVVSGKRNFVYLARVQLSEESSGKIEQTVVDEAIDVFYDAVGFHHLAVLLDRLTLRSNPTLASQKARDVDLRLGIRSTIVQFDGSVNGAIDAIPADADAVLLGPLLRLDEEGLSELAQGLIDRRLPSFSLLGRFELASGILMTSGGREEDAVRYARRLALIIQRILLGEEPGGMDVRIAEPQRLAINMRTASAIGFFPRYAVLSDAEQLNAEALDTGEPLGLNEAMAEALDANLNLKVVAVDPLVAAESTRLARSQLFPQLGIGARATRIDEDRANPLFQAERSVDAQISGSQVVYSDDIRAAYKIAAYFENASHYGYQVEVLDTLQTAARAYLTVLRARALETVRRSNLEVTRANLELARLRRSIGASGRGDVLRWESQLATDRQNVVTAEADTRVALTGFNQVLNRPQNKVFTPADEDVAQSISLFEDQRFRALIDNAAVWEMFQDFSVQKALSQSPELAQIDQLRSAQERQVVAARRKYYVPELSLSGNLGTNLSRGGAGSSVSALGLDDESWTLAISATWPLFTGGALRAGLNRERYSLLRIERNRRAVEEQLEARTRVALHRASGTYPSLEFSSEAAVAANENLEMIIDAYRTGAVSVTELIDAQNAALAADLRTVDARYAYLIDVVDVLRATGDFSLLVDPGSTEAWFQEVESYIRNRRTSMPR